MPHFPINDFGLAQRKSGFLRYIHSYGPVIHFRPRRRRSQRSDYEQG